MSGMFHTFLLNRKRHKSYVIVVNEETGTAWTSPPLKRKDANHLYDGLFEPGITEAWRAAGFHTRMVVQSCDRVLFAALNDLL